MLENRFASGSFERVGLPVVAFLGRGRSERETETNCVAGHIGFEPAIRRRPLAYAGANCGQSNA